MDNIKVRRFTKGDEKRICEVVAKDALTENIKDYPRFAIDKLIKEHNEDLIIYRANVFHVYVLIYNSIIVGVGMIGPYWDSLTESSFFTIFIDPDYKGRGLGRKIIETLESDEYFKRADRVEIPASITAVEFYKHFGYGFKELGHIVDAEGMYRMEKYPKISNNNVDINQYNMRPYINNQYHNYKEFVSNLKKNNYSDDELYKNIWIIQLNGEDIGIYDKGVSEKNVCLISRYQGRGIEKQVVEDFNKKNNL